MSSLCKHRVPYSQPQLGDNILLHVFWVRYLQTGLQCLFNGGSEIGLSYVPPNRTPKIPAGLSVPTPLMVWRRLPPLPPSSGRRHQPPPRFSPNNSTRPPSCRRRQAAATAAVALPPPRCCCLRRRHTLAKLPPPLPSWPLPLTPRSHQAATAAAKLVAAPALSPRFRLPLCFNCYRRCCHRCRFRAFS
jgi:hypothetical protein